MDLSPPHFVWPPVTKAVETAVLRQLHESVSIYDRSGVFERFEEKFRRYHGRSRGCLFNSGTSALHAAFVAMDLKAGDEVICPAYTFFATVSPLLWTKASPVFCDCDDDGNLDPVALDALITEKTRAVVVTHLWGVPAQLDEISRICREHRLLLVEDCSHAHGARRNGRLVGTLGDMAIWSLQGAKTVTGGEGGILLTDDDELFFRALAMGHYNKRCRQEIPTDHPLARFAVTGMGLKLRAHPLAIAIAEVLFDELETILAARARTAALWCTYLQKAADIRFPQLSEDVQPSWYAFVIRSEDEHTRDRLLARLHAQGLIEADAPGSTQPLNLLPLFQQPEQIFGDAEGRGLRARPAPGMFPRAERDWSSSIKLPVFSGGTRREDQLITFYGEALEKVCSDVT